MRRIAYLARYAPGAPTPWLMAQPWSFIEDFIDAVSEIVRREHTKEGGDG